jgi:hypothetical protein
MKNAFLLPIFLGVLGWMISCKQAEKTYIVDAVHHSEDFKLPVYLNPGEAGSRRFTVIAEINDSIFVTKDLLQSKDSAAVFHLQVEAKKRGGDAAILIEALPQLTSTEVPGCVSIHVTGKVIKFVD